MRRSLLFPVLLALATASCSLPTTGDRDEEAFLEWVQDAYPDEAASDLIEQGDETCQMLDEAAEAGSDDASSWRAKKAAWSAFLEQSDDEYAVVPITAIQDLCPRHVDVITG